MTNENVQPTEVAQKPKVTKRGRSKAITEEQIREKAKKYSSLTEFANSEDASSYHAFLRLRKKEKSLSDTNESPNADSIVAHMEKKKRGRKAKIKTEAEKVSVAVEAEKIAEPVES